MRRLPSCARPLFALAIFSLATPVLAMDDQKDIHDGLVGCAAAYTALAALPGGSASDNAAFEAKAAEFLEAAYEVSPVSNDATDRQYGKLSEELAVEAASATDMDALERDMMGLIDGCAELEDAIVNG